MLCPGVQPDHIERFAGRNGPLRLLVVGGERVAALLVPGKTSHHEHTAPSLLGGRPVPAERALLADPGDLPPDRPPLADEELPYRLGEPRIAEEVHAVGRLRVEAAELLELAAGARLEAADALARAVVDRRVVADVEVEEAVLLERPPVAAVEDVALPDVDRAGDVAAGERAAVGILSGIGLNLSPTSTRRSRRRASTATPRCADPAQERTNRPGSCERR